MRLTVNMPSVLMRCSDWKPHIQIIIEIMGDKINLMLSHVMVQLPIPSPKPSKLNGFWSEHTLG